MEFTIQEERGAPNTYQAEILLGHGPDVVYETLWFLLDDQEQAELLHRCCEQIIYNYAAGWNDPDCHLEDIAARLSALLNEDKAEIEQLLEHFCYEDLGLKGSNTTAQLVRLRLHYFDRNGSWHRVYVNGCAELPVCTPKTEPTLSQYSHK